MLMWRAPSTARGVVDPVADHRYSGGVGQQFTQRSRLALHSHPRVDPVDAQLLGDAPGGALVVPGDRNGSIPAVHIRCRCGAGWVTSTSCPSILARAPKPVSESNSSTFGQRRLRDGAPDRSGRSRAFRLVFVAAARASRPSGGRRGRRRVLFPG